MQDANSLSTIFINSGLGNVAASNIVTTAPTPSPPAATPAAHRKRFNGGQLAGIVIGCVVGVSLLYLAAYGAWVMHQRQQRKASGKGSEPSSQINGEYAPMDANGSAAQPKSSKYQAWLPVFLKTKQGRAAAVKDEKSSTAGGDAQVTTAQQMPTNITATTTSYTSPAGVQ